MKKEILHVVECFSGGVYDFIVSLVNGLPEFNHTILYAKRESFNEKFKDDFSKKVSFIYWKNASREINLRKDFLAGKELYKILSEKKYDKIHLHSSKAGFIGRVVGRLKNQHDRVLYTTHGVSFLRKDTSNLKNNMYILLEKIGMYMGGEVIACSKSEAEFMQNKGIKKTQYIYNGVEVPKNLPKVEKNENTINILTVGRITYQKNPKLFNEIAEKFVYNDKIKFTWVGDGELRDELKSSNINITGWKNQREVLEELCKGNIYLSTSLWEGLPLSVLQAMVVELPLVLSDCIGNIDLVKSERYGYSYHNYKEAIEKIKKLLEDRIDYTQREEIKLNFEFSIQNMNKSYKKKYSL